MTSGGPPGRYLSPLEFEQAVRGLVGDAPWNRLRAIARLECRRTRWPDPEDLLQEAFFRALEGSRQCPRSVDIVRFLGEVMHSIASDGVKAAQRRGLLGGATTPTQVSTFADLPERTSATGSVLAERPSISDELETEQECARIRKAVVSLFADDATAEMLVAGILEGLEGEELRSLVDLDPVEFASKRRLIRRRIDAAFPEAWIP